MTGASCLLMSRAIALWKRDRRVAIPLISLHLGQWVISIHNGFIAREAWSESVNGEEGCIFTELSWSWMRAQFVYSRCQECCCLPSSSTFYPIAIIFDFIVISVTVRALVRFSSRSPIWKIIFVDGFAYFLRTPSICSDSTLWLYADQIAGSGFTLLPRMLDGILVSSQYPLGIYLHRYCGGICGSGGVSILRTPLHKWKAAKVRKYPPCITRAMRYILFL